MRSALIFIIFILNLSAFSFEVPNYCNDENIDLSGLCLKCKKTTPLSLVSDIGEKITKGTDLLNFYDQKVHELKSLNQTVKDQLAIIYRTLRGQKAEASYEIGRMEIEKIHTNFKKLTILSKESAFLQKKYAICLKSCSPSRTLEVLDDIEKIQKLKATVLISEPILANSNFEKMFETMNNDFLESDNFFPTNKFEESLKLAIFDNLETIRKREIEISRYKISKEKASTLYSTPDHLEGYVSGLIDQFPNLSEEVVSHLIANQDFDEKKEMACFYFKNFKNYTTKKEYQALALDAGLFILPFALGPMGRVGSLAIDTLWGKRLLQYGLKGTESLMAMQKAKYPLQIAFVANEANVIYDQYKGCKRIEGQFYINPYKKKLDDLKECKKDLSDRILLSEIASISIATTSIGPKALRYLKSASVPNSKFIVNGKLLLKDLGVGDNKVIIEEIGRIKKTTRDLNNQLKYVSTERTGKKGDIEFFINKNDLAKTSKNVVIIPKEKELEYQKKITADTIEFFYIPDANVPHLPKSVNKVGHVALRIGDKVYHQTGGSGFITESFENFLNTTKKDYAVFGQVLEVSPKEMMIMRAYYDQINIKKLPYSFLFNNCSQTICRALSLSDFEKIPQIAGIDPLLLLTKIKRNDRVVMKTLYNADKSASSNEIRVGTLNNRLLFYGVPSTVVAGAGYAGFEAIDYVIDFIEQINEDK